MTTVALKALLVFVFTLTGPQYFLGCGYVSSGNVEWNGENWSRLGTGVFISP